MTCKAKLEVARVFKPSAPDGKKDKNGLTDLSLILSVFLFT